MECLRVLVVENEALVRELMVTALTEAGFDVDEAPSADQAEPLLCPGVYSMLVTDVHMPGKMDGLDLARQMRLREPQLPILLVTGRPDILDDLAHKEMKASLLAKPFSLGMLTATVTRLLASPV